MPLKFTSFKSSIVLLLSVFLLLFVKGMENEEKVFSLENLQQNMMKVGIFPFLNGKDLLMLQLLNKNFYNKPELNELRLAYGKTFSFLGKLAYVDLMVLLPYMQEENFYFYKIWKQLMEHGFTESHFERAILCSDALGYPQLVLTYNEQNKDFLMNTQMKGQTKVDLFDGLLQKQETWTLPHTQILPDSSVYYIRNGRKHVIATNSNHQIKFWTYNELPFSADENYESEGTVYVRYYYVSKLFVKDDEVFVKLRTCYDNDILERKLSDLIEKGIRK